jgi:hypothetical protein
MNILEQPVVSPPKTTIDSANHQFVSMTLHVIEGMPVLKTSVVDTDNARKIRTLWAFVVVKERSPYNDRDIASEVIPE